MEHAKEQRLSLVLRFRHVEDVEEQVTRLLDKVPSLYSKFVETVEGREMWSEVHARKIKN